MAPFPVDDENLYQTYMSDSINPATVREFYATIEDTAVMLARLNQPHRLGGWYISNLNGEVCPLEGELRFKVIARAQELAAMFGSSPDLS